MTGCCYGIIVSGLNHAMHSMSDNTMESVGGDCKDCPKKGSISSTHNSSDGNMYSYGLDGGWHLVGPSLVGLGAPMSLFKPLGA